ALGPSSRLPWRPASGAAACGDSVFSPPLRPFTFNLQPLRPPKSCSCKTYGSPRKRCKQKTYGLAKPFRCNTYKKQGGGVAIMVNQALETSHPPSSSPPGLRASAPLWLIRLPFSVHTSKFRIPQPLCLPLLRKLPGCVPTIPILERTSHMPDFRPGKRHAFLFAGSRFMVLGSRAASPRPRYSRRYRGIREKAGARGLEVDESVYLVTKGGQTHVKTTLSGFANHPGYFFLLGGCRRSITDFQRQAADAASLSPPSRI